MQGYYNPSAYYPVAQPAPPPQYAAQPLASLPYISHYRNTPQFDPPRQLPPQGPGYTTYQRHRYETYVPPPPEPAPKPRRTQSLAVPNPKAKPLKSAMKKRNHERSESMGEPISRTSSRAPSDHQQRERAGSMSRSRANSNPPQFVPDHAFLTFPSSNEIRLENMPFEHTVDDLRQNILPAWPHGVASELHREHVWRATFNGTPWASAGEDLIMARRMICTIWAVMSNHGYSYLTTANTATPPAKLIFMKTSREATPLMFTVSISQSGGKFSFLDAPPQLVHNLSTNLRNMFPRRIASDRATEDGIFVIEVRRSSSAPDVDKSVLSAYILGYFNSVGFKLDGSLPLGKTTPLGFGSKKELWIFKGMQTRSGSASGHNSVNAPNSAHGHGEY